MMVRASLPTDEGSASARWPCRSGEAARTHGQQGPAESEKRRCRCS